MKGNDGIFLLVVVGAIAGVGYMIVSSQQAQTQAIIAAQRAAQQQNSGGGNILGEVLGGVAGLFGL